MMSEELFPEESLLLKEAKQACSQASDCLSQTQSLLTQIEELHSRLSLLVGAVYDTLHINKALEKQEIILTFEASHDIGKVCDEITKLTREFEKATAKAEAYTSVAVQMLYDSPPLTEEE